VKYSFSLGKSEANRFIFSFRRMPTRFASKDKLKVHRVNISTIGRELREGCILFSPAFLEPDN